MSEVHNLYTQFKEQQLDPATPASNFLALYVKYNKHIYTKDPSGVVRDITSNVAALTDLSDVVLTSPANGNYLRYSGSNWVNSTLPSNFSTIDDLTDVNTSGVASTQVLTFKSPNYKPKKNQGAMIASNLSVGQTIVEAPSPIDQLLFARNTNVTNVGDVSELSDTTSYFKPFNDGDYGDFGPYMLCGFMKLSLSAGSGTVNIKPYFTDGVDPTEITDPYNTSPLMSFNMTSGTDVYWNGFYIFKTNVGGPYYTLGVENSASGDITCYYRLVWYKMGHNIYL